MHQHPPGVAGELEEDIAFVMEVPRALLPWLPELLADLPELSGATGDVLTVLRQAGLPEGASVLDLGSGRGEIALAVAGAFGATVTGVEGMVPFVEAAREKAVAHGWRGGVILPRGTYGIPFGGPQAMMPC